MADLSILRRLLLLRSRPFAATSTVSRTLISASRSHYTTATETKVENNERKGKWFTLPLFTSTIDGASLGKYLIERRSATKNETTTTTTALKWVLRCCPKLPRSLVQKLFRLRQVRRESSDMTCSDVGIHAQEHKLKRVAAKDLMKVGDQVYLPITVQEFPSEKADCLCTDEEMKFIHSLELYKDSAIIVINKPPGMPVQGGIGIKRSLDELASAYLKYEYPEPPRLVHRLDRDSSGILVMGRTQLSATVLHSIFREKTFGASIKTKDPGNNRRILQRRYWALVIGSPRRSEGLISKPLGKVVVDNGKSERITVVDNDQTMSSQHAITEYRVIASSRHGYTWLELSPLTGRKHQLRVHCAEVLGTPIVGDYKYGWQSHRKLKLVPSSLELKPNEKLPKENAFPFGLDLESGHISEKQPRLHLHCKEMVLPNLSVVIKHAQLSSDCDLAEIDGLKLVAPLPSYMQRSWDILHF